MSLTGDNATAVMLRAECLKLLWPQIERLAEQGRSV